MSLFKRSPRLSFTLDQTARRRLPRKIGLGYGFPAVKVQLKPKLAFGEEPPEEPITRNPVTGWYAEAKRAGAIVQKLGMTCDWDDTGTRVPLTMLHIPQCQVIQTKTVEKEGYYALQMGAGDKKIKHTTKPMMGHFAKADANPKTKVWEFPVTKDCMLPVGTTIHAPHFLPGQLVNLQGFTKGKGFQGGMKRWGFSGQNASHGVSVTHRSIGSTGCRQSPGRVFKGKKMPGNMGNEKNTIQNLMVFKVDTENDVVYVKGSVPGPKKSWLRLYDSERSQFFYQTPPFPAYTPNPEEPLPSTIRHRFDYLPPDFWAMSDRRDPDSYEIMRAERLGQIVSEKVLPQTLPDILQSITDQRHEIAEAKRLAAEAEEKKRIQQKKGAGKKKDK